MISMLECKVPPLAYVFFFSIIAYLLSRFWPLYLVHQPIFKILGCTLCCVGIAVMVTSAVQFRIRRTTLSPISPIHASVFVSNGLFRITRNPMYLGMALMMMGGVFVLGALSGGIVVALFMWLITKFQIEPEERALAARFGESYLQYKKTVRRWL